MARAAVLRDPATTAGVGQFAVIRSVASSVGVEAIPVDIRDADEIERGGDRFRAAPAPACRPASRPTKVRDGDQSVRLIRDYVVSAMAYS